MMLEQLHYFVLNYVDIITRDTLALWLTYCTSNSAHNNRVDTIYGLPGLSLWAKMVRYLPKCSIWVWNHTAVIPTSITISYIFYLSNADIGYHWNLSELNSNGGVPTVFNLKQTYLLLRIRYIYLLFYITHNQPTYTYLYKCFSYYYYSLLVLLFFSSSSSSFFLSCSVGEMVWQNNLHRKEGKKIQNSTTLCLVRNSQHISLCHFSNRIVSGES